MYIKKNESIKKKTKQKKAYDQSYKVKQTEHWFCKSKVN